MADIQFNEPTYTRPAVVQESKGLIALVQRLGLAKSDQQANYVLIGIMISAIFLTMLVFIFSNPKEGMDDQSSLPAENIIPGL